MTLSGYQRNIGASFCVIKKCAWNHGCLRRTRQVRGEQKALANLSTINRLDKGENRELVAIANKVALISGITGQDGAALAEFLLEKGYEVHGIKRRSSSFNTGRVDHLYTDLHEENLRFTMHFGDLTDATNLIRIIQETQPEEIYNLAAQSHVQVSFETPEYTANTDALGALRMLEAIRILNLVGPV